MKQLKDALRKLAPVLLAALLGCSLTLLYDFWNLGKPDAGYVIGYTLLAAAIVWLMSLSRLTGWITFCALVIFILGKLLGGWRPIEYAGRILEAAKRGEVGTYVSQLALTASVGITLFAYITLEDSTYVSWLISCTLLSVAACWMLGMEANEAFFGLLVFVLCSMYALTGKLKYTGYKAMISLGLIAALAATALVTEGKTVPALEDASRRAVKLAIDTFNLDRDELEQRRSFNIGSYGWRTRNESFGGPAYPRSDEVLRVTSDGTLYLRGSVRYTYNGRAWVDESNAEKAGKIKRYMLSGLEGLLYKGEYSRAFDLDKSGEDRGFALKTASVEVLGDNLYWAVYTPNRTKSVESELKLYYNNIGELFASRQLQNGDTYSFEYYEFINADGLADIIDEAEAETDKNWPFVALLNRDVPQGVDAQVRELTQRITAGSASPYEAALAIRDHLRQNGSYTLSPGYVPDGADFVSWFINDGMKGYCMYFASAMTLMARMAGLPARYVEGYLVENGGKDILVTGRNAHAWSEVYFKGFGWVTFDATPADPHFGEEDKNGNDVSPTATPAAPSVTPPPAATPSPSPAPSPTPEEDDMDWPDDDWPEEQPSPTPDTSLPEQDDPFGQNQGGSDSDDSNDMPEQTSGGKYIWIILLLLALLAGAAALVTARIRKTVPKRREAVYKTNTEKLLFWYRLSIDVLKYRGMDYAQGFTPAEFALRAVQADLAPGEFTAVSAIVMQAAYGRIAPTGKQVAQAEDCYGEIVLRAGRITRARLLLRRLLGGGRVSLNIP
ncbi:MAG: transglutaminase domain-containing protein [Clostridiales bacterium]|nr:transglutaminase domain-containing protein [Clostridiales bacterium]